MTKESPGRERGWEGEREGGREGGRGEGREGGRREGGRRGGRECKKLRDVVAVKLHVNFRFVSISYLTVTIHVLSA